MIIFSNLFKKVQKMKNHKTPEDMSVYCPPTECSECRISLCDRFGVVYEGCDCEECKAQRRRMRELVSRYYRI